MLDAFSGTLFAAYVTQQQARLDALMEAEGPGGAVAAAGDGGGVPAALRLEARLPPARWPALVAEATSD